MINEELVKVKGGQLFGARISCAIGPYDYRYLMYNPEFNKLHWGTLGQIDVYDRPIVYFKSVDDFNKLLDKVDEQEHKIHRPEYKYYLKKVWENASDENNLDTQEIFILEKDTLFKPIKLYGIDLYLESKVNIQDNDDVNIGESFIRHNNKFYDVLADKIKSMSLDNIVNIINDISMELYNEPLFLPIEKANEFYNNLSWSDKRDIEDSYDSFRMDDRQFYNSREFNLKWLKSHIPSGAKYFPHDKDNFIDFSMWLSQPKDIYLKGYLNTFLYSEDFSKKLLDKLLDNEIIGESLDSDSDKWVIYVIDEFNTGNFPLFFEEEWEDYELDSHFDVIDDITKGKKFNSEREAQQYLVMFKEEYLYQPEKWKLNKNLFIKQIKDIIKEFPEYQDNIIGD